MPLTQNDLDWFAARLMIAVYDTNKEYRMSVEIRGLAETVRRAKSVLGVATAASERLETAAVGVAKRVKQVDAMTGELIAAEKELGEVVEALSNGGPPLDEQTNSSPSTLTLDQAATYVREANR